jgi:ankyrin repeat protein
MKTLQSLFKSIEKKSKKSILPDIQELAATGRLENRCEEFDNYTPLMHAVRCGNSEAVKLLISFGAYVEARLPDLDTPIIIATRSYLFHNNIDVLQQLIEKGVDINAKDNTGATALIYASIMGDFNIAKILLDAGADPKIKNKDKDTAYVYAMLGNRTELANLLKC